MPLHRNYRLKPPPGIYSLKLWLAVWQVEFNGMSAASSTTFFLVSQGKGSIDAGYFRILGYIEANLEGDLTIDRMASIACLSRYHFARAFKQAVRAIPSLRQR